MEDRYRQLCSQHQRPVNLTFTERIALTENLCPGHYDFSDVDLSNLKDAQVVFDFLTNELDVSFVNFDRCKLNTADHFFQLALALEHRGDLVGLSVKGNKVCQASALALLHLARTSRLKSLTAENFPECFQESMDSQIKQNLQQRRRASSVKRSVIQGLLDAYCGEEEIPVNEYLKVVPQDSVPASLGETGKLLRRRRSSRLGGRSPSFAEVLKPLTRETFDEVVTEVEDTIGVVRHTLELLDLQSFEASLVDIMSAITTKAGELLLADRATIFMHDECNHELWALVKQAKGEPKEIRIPDTAGIAGECAQTGKSVRIPYDFYDDPRSAMAKEQDKATGYRTYTLICLPLYDDNDKLVAVVQLLNKIRRGTSHLRELKDRLDVSGFTKADEHIFAKFGSCLRLIMECSELFYEAGQKQKAADALVEATRSLGQTKLDIEEVGSKVMEEARKLLNADRSTLWILDPNSGDLSANIQVGGETKTIKVKSGHGYVGQVAATRQALNIPFDLYDAEGAETSQAMDQVNMYRTASLLNMPIFDSEEQLIGVTTLVNKKRRGEFPSYDHSEWPKPPEMFRASFTKKDETVMETFNTQVGVALKNAAMFKKIKDSEALQAIILRTLNNGVVAVDTEGKITLCNQCFVNIIQKTRTGAPNDPAEYHKTELLSILKLKERSFEKCVAAALAGNSAEQEFVEQSIIVDGEAREVSVNVTINAMYSFNETSSTINGALIVLEDISDEKRLKNTLYRYMTQEVADQLVQSEGLLGGERRDVTVLFSDIRSYTTLTEGMSAESVVALLNEYFEQMVEAVFEFKGTLDKFIGDAIMAVFGSPLPLEDHPKVAVDCALDMRERLKAFNAKRVEEGADPIRIGIGVNTDFVVSGNIGSKRRMEYTSIGDGVNLGSRLEGTTKEYGTDIIISENTHQRCGDAFITRELDLICVKGKSRPVAIFEVIGKVEDGIDAEVQRKLDSFKEARTLYLSRNFQQAKSLFLSILETDPHDVASKRYAEHCDHWLGSPPPNDWRGEWVMTSK